ncbi:Regulator of spindle pole body duplication [Globisporangium polare]
MAASTKQQVRRLPSSWLIVTVAVSVTSELVISRIMNDGKPPVTFCLPGVRWKSTMETIEALIRASRESLSGNSADATGSWSTEKKKQWWNSRKEIDEKLGAAIKRFQVRRMSSSLATDDKFLLD